MICPRCKYKETRYDTLTSMWFCPKCNNLYDGPAPIESTETKQVDASVQQNVNVVDDALSENIIEIEETDIVDYDRLPKKLKRKYKSKKLTKEEFATKMSLWQAFIIGIPLLIPFVNIAYYVMLINSDYDEDVRISYMGLMMANIVSYIVLILMVFIGFNQKILPDAVVRLQKAVDKVVVSTINDSHTLSYEKIDLPTKPVNKLYEEVDVEAVEEDVTTAVHDSSVISLEFMDGAYFTGDVVKRLIETYSEDGIAYLLRTNAMVEKNGDAQWVNYGAQVSMAQLSESGTYFVNHSKIQSSYEFYTDEYFEKNFIDYENIYSKKFIFRVIDSSLFKCNVLYTGTGEFMGFAFTEEVKNE